MYRRRSGTHVENSHKGGRRKKCNEALTMRCQISLAKMAQFLMDNGKYNGTDDILTDLQCPRPQQALGGMKTNVLKRPQKKIPFPLRHERNPSPLNFGAPEEKADSQIDNYCDEVLPSESWMRFVRRDSSLSGASESEEKIVAKDQSMESIFSKVIRIEVQSADVTAPNSSVEFDLVESTTHDETSQSASEPKESLETTRLISDSLEAIPPMKESLDETLLIKADSKSSKKTLSNYQFPISLVTNDQVKHCRNFNRNRIRFSQARRLTNGPESSKNVTKKDPKDDIQICNVKIALPDVNNLNRVCINGSRMPAHNKKIQRSKTQKTSNTPDRYDKWIENKQEDCFDRWRPYSAGDSNESSSYGGGISQYTFQNIHEKDPNIEPTPSSYTSESNDLHSSRPISSISVTSCHSQLIDYPTCKTNEGQDTISNSIQRISTNSKGKNIDQIESSHDLNNNKETGRLSSHSNSQVSVSSKKEEIDISPRSSNTYCPLKSKEMQSNGDDIGSYDNVDKNDNLNPLKYSRKNSQASAENSGVDCNDFASTSDVDLFTSEMTINSSQKSNSYLKDTQCFSDSRSDDICFEGTVKAQNNKYDRALFSWKPNTPNEEMPFGFYQGISSRYIPPVVVPPPFPGRDRAKMVMKVKHGETKERTNVSVKFKSDVKECMPSHLQPASKEGLDCTNTSIKNYRLHINENPSNQKKKGQKIYGKPRNKRPNTRSCSFVEKNIQCVGIAKHKNGQKNVLRLPVVDCDLSVVSRMGEEIHFDSFPSLFES